MKKLVINPSHKKQRCATNIKKFGATGDGISDDTESIQRALNCCLHICFPPGQYRISKTIIVPSGATIMGAGTGSTTILAPNNTSFNVFQIDRKSNVHLADYTIRKEPGNATPAHLVKLYGIEICGKSRDIFLDHIHVDGCLRGFNIAGGEGSQCDRARRITLRDCLATHSVEPTAMTGQFGFNIDDSDEVTLDNCHASNHWLDGLKIRKKTRNVTLRGGSFNHNGVAKVAGLAGDGIDAYAGGDTFNFSDVICEHNNGNGITVKTGPLNNLPESGCYGYVKNATFMTLRLCNNTASGLYLTRSCNDEPEEPLVSSVTIHGGLFEGNGANGIYLRGRNISIVSPLVKGNGRDGIAVTQTTFDADIVSAKVLANGVSHPGSYPGISIAGTRIQIRGGTVNGKDADTITQDSDYTALCSMHNHGIVVSESATDVLIDDVEVMHSATPPEIWTRMTKGVCIINQKGAGSPEGTRYGGPGSRYLQTDGVPGSILYLKQSGYGVSGWQAIDMSTGGQPSWVLSPRNFGAVGDGVADDTAALVRTFAAASVNNAVVDLRHYTYLISNPGDATGNIISVKAARLHVTGDGGVNIKISDDCGNYRAIFGPAGVMSVRQWCFEKVGFDKNAQNNVITDPGDSASGRYCATTYGGANISGEVVISGCMVWNSDAVVDFYFPEPGKSRPNKSISIRYNKWLDARLGGDGSDYDQSYINISCDVGQVIGNEFHGVSWLLAPRTAIETHCGSVIVQGNVIKKFQTGMNVCMGLRAGETKDDGQVVQGNVLEVSRDGINLWPTHVKHSTKPDSRIAGSALIVSGNSILHRWTQYPAEFTKPRLWGIQIVASSDGHLNFEDWEITDNVIVYDIPDGVDAIERTGKPGFAPAIGISCSDLPIEATSIRVRHNHIDNAPGPAFGWRLGTINGIDVSGNTARNCGISTANGLSTAYQCSFYLDSSFVNAPLFINNVAIYTDNRNAHSMFYIHDRAKSRKMIKLRLNDLDAPVSVQYLAGSGTDTVISIEGGIVPSADTTVSSTLCTTGSYLELADKSQAEQMVKLRSAGWSLEAYGSAPPTTGKWPQYSRMINIAPVAGGYKEWLAIVGGTPGTWKGSGLIEA